MSDFEGFSKELIHFFQQLKTINYKKWYEAIIDDTFYHFQQMLPLSVEKSHDKLICPWIEKADSRRIRWRASISA